MVEVTFGMEVAHLRQIARKAVPELLILTGLALGCCSWLWERGLEGRRTSVPGPRFPEDDRAVDCGAVSLYVICRLDDQECSLDELRKLTETDALGTDMLRLKNAAITRGFKVEACRCSFAKLYDHVSRARQYAILHSPKSHFAAVIRTSGNNRVRFVDGDLGVHDLTQEELSELLEWDGVALLLTND
jgi:ABC-type bacteriocin/lantibiotic exporter with double-glycine peptidase domain